MQTHLRANFEGKSGGCALSLGYSGLVKGDIGNDLIAISEEPNVRIMETKSPF
jgi:hypothetical protein